MAGVMRNQQEKDGLEMEYKVDDRGSTTGTGRSLPYPKP